jgi:hypothetical protein
MTGDQFGFGSFCPQREMARNNVGVDCPSGNLARNGVITESDCVPPLRFTATDLCRGCVSAGQTVKAGLPLMGQNSPGMKEFVAVSAQWPNRL